MTCKFVFLFSVILFFAISFQLSAADDVLDLIEQARGRLSE